MELLLTVLKFLEHKNLIRIFQDKRSIGLGDSWRESVDEAIDEASVAVCFLTPEYFASDFVIEHEVPRIQVRQRSGWLKVLPILLKDSLWEIDTWWSELQILTDENGRPLVNGGGMDDRDRVQRHFVELARQIFRLLPDLPTPPEPPRPAPPGNGAASRRNSKSRASGNRRVRPGNSNGTKSAIIVPSQHDEERLFEELLSYLADSDGDTMARGTVSTDSKSNERLPGERRENAQSQGNKEMMVHRGNHRLSFFTFITCSLRGERAVKKARSNEPVAIDFGTSAHYVFLYDFSGSMYTPVQCNETARTLADRSGVMRVPSGSRLDVHLLEHAEAAWQHLFTLPWELLLRNQIDVRIEPKDANKLEACERFGATLFRGLFSGAAPVVPYDAIGNLRIGILKNGRLNTGNIVEIREPYEDVCDTDTLRGNSDWLRDMVHGSSAVYTSGFTRVSGASVPSGPCAASTINVRDVLFKDPNKLEACDWFGATLFCSLFSGGQVQLVESFFGARRPLASGPSTAQVNTGSALKASIEVLERFEADHLLGQTRALVFRCVASNFDIGDHHDVIADNLTQTPFAVAIDSGHRSVLLDASVCDLAAPVVPYDAIGNLRIGTLKNGWLNTGNMVEISEPYEDVCDSNILRGNSGRIRDMIHGSNAVYTSGSTRVSGAPVPSGPCAAGAINVRDVLFKMIANGRPILHELEADRELKCNLVGDRSGNNITAGDAIQDRSWPVLLSESLQEVNIS
jgi:hypothetical protein